MDESISKGEEKPKPRNSTTEKENKTKNTIQPDPPISVIGKKEGRNWGSIVDRMLLPITLIIVWQAIRSADYASVQAKAAIESDSLTRASLIYEGRKDSINSLAQNKKDSTSLAVAESSNVLTRKTLELAQKRFIIDNRPWVGIKSMTLDTFEIGKNVWVSVGIQNYGKTPATKLDCWIGIEPHTILTFNVFGNTGTIKGIKPSSVLPPSEVTFYKMPTDGKIDKLAFESYNKKEFFMYVYGRIAYSDPFKGKDTTTFCSYYDVDIKTFRSTPFYNTMK